MLTELREFFDWLEPYEDKGGVTLEWLKATAPRSPAVEKLFEWVELRAANGLDMGGVVQLRIDADHSGLLRRLVRGEWVAPEAPPLACSYPWPELVRTGLGTPFEVYEPHPSINIFPPDSIIIEQSAWRILERLGENDWIVTYWTTDTELIAKERADGTWGKGGRIPKRLSKSRWRVQSLGPDPRSPERQLWSLTRIQASV